MLPSVDEVVVRLHRCRGHVGNRLLLLHNLCFRQSDAGRNLLAKLIDLHFQDAADSFTFGAGALQKRFAFHIQNLYIRGEHISHLHKAPSN